MSEIKDEKKVKDNDDKKEKKVKKTVKNNQQAEMISPTKIKSGMIVRIYQKIKEVNPKGETKERLQFFEGTVLARKNGNEPGATITIRKVSNGIGVEKIFPLHSPTIAKVELLQKIKTRRAKLYFLRRGYKKRLKKIKA
ncbi:MAG: 50S ribosomal protein L19 [Patescibacteria group bacterium]|nr:50S ribosomal protein L19 [Patescibacteria group bacterium]